MKQAKYWQKQWEQYSFLKRVLYRFLHIIGLKRKMPKPARKYLNLKKKSRRKRIKKFFGSVVNAGKEVMNDSKFKTAVSPTSGLGIKDRCGMAAASVAKAGYDEYKYFTEVGSRLKKYRKDIKKLKKSGEFDDVIGIDAERIAAQFGTKSSEEVESDLLSEIISDKKLADAYIRSSRPNKQKDSKLKKELRRIKKAEKRKRQKKRAKERKALLQGIAANIPSLEVDSPKLNCSVLVKNNVDDTTPSFDISLIKANKDESADAHVLVENSKFRVTSENIRSTKPTYHDTITDICDSVYGRRDKQESMKDTGEVAKTMIRVIAKQNEQYGSEKPINRFKLNSHCDPHPNHQTETDKKSESKVTNDLYYEKVRNNKPDGRPNTPVSTGAEEHSSLHLVNPRPAEHTVSEYESSCNDNIETVRDYEKLKGTMDEGEGSMLSCTPTNKKCYTAGSVNTDFFIGVNEDDDEDDDDYPVIVEDNDDDEEYDEDDLWWKEHEAFIEHKYRNIPRTLEVTLEEYDPHEPEHIMLNEYKLPIIYIGDKRACECRMPDFKAGILYMWDPRVCEEMFYSDHGELITDAIFRSTTTKRIIMIPSLKLLRARQLADNDD